MSFFHPQTDGELEQASQSFSNNIIVLKENRDVQIQQIAGKGRGLIWAPLNGGTLIKGTTVLRLKPELITLNEDNTKVCCHVCFASKGKSGGTLECCPDCEIVRYCSEDCKAKDASIHQLECRALRNSQMVLFDGDEHIRLPVDPGMRERMTARLIWLRHRLGPEWWAPIESLMINGNIDLKEIKLAELAKYISKSVVRTNNGPFLDMWAKLGKLGLKSNVDDVRDIYCRVLANAYPIGNLVENQGLALSSTAAMLNHSCVPNVIVSFPKGLKEGQCMHIVALKDVKAGEELTRSYINTSEPYAFRQTSLRDHHIQECKCPLCLKNKLALEGKINYVDARQAVWCGRSHCQSWVALDWDSNKPKGLCTGCKQPCIFDAKRVADAVQDGERFYLAMKGAEYGDQIKPTFWQPLKELTVIQPPSAYPLLMILKRTEEIIDILSRRFVEAKKHKEAKDMDLEAYRCAMTIMAGLSAGEDGIVAEGDPDRLRRQFQLLSITRTISERGMTKQQWQAASPSIYFNRLPKDMPAPDKEWGVKIFMRILREMSYGYGEDVQSSGDINFAWKEVQGWITLADVQEFIRLDLQE